MLTKSAGTKNIFRGKLGFLKIATIYKGKQNLYLSYGLLFTVPRQIFLIPKDSKSTRSPHFETIVRLEGCCWTLISSI